MFQLVPELDAGDILVGRGDVEQVTVLEERRLARDQSLSESAQERDLGAKRILDGADPVADPGLVGAHLDESHLS